nr:hypothetical protein [Comamonas testosteroni]
MTLLTSSQKIFESVYSHSNHPITTELLKKATRQQQIQDFKMQIFLDFEFAAIGTPEIGALHPIKH